MATHSNILAWRISWTEEPGELHSMGSQNQDTTEQHTHTHTHTHILSLVFMTTNLGRKILMTIVLIIPILQMKKPSHSEVK